MEIQRVEIFKLAGVEYSTLKEVYTKVENDIGAIIDTFDVTLTPKQKLNILSGILSNKRALSGFLNIEIDFGDGLQGDMRNLLDIADLI